MDRALRGIGLLLRIWWGSGTKQVSVTQAIICRRSRNMSTIKDDPFFQEGQAAAQEGTDIEDCPYPEGTDGQNGWLIGFRTCPRCGQCHEAVHRCQGSAWGKLPKDPAKQSKAANARWTKWRHDRPWRITSDRSKSNSRPRRRSRRLSQRLRSPGAGDFKVMFQGM